jgi:hypothetical protein
MDPTHFLRHPEIQISDFGAPWSAAIIIVGFVLAWITQFILERVGFTRHVWYLPLFFLALVVLFSSLVGLVVAP